VETLASYGERLYGSFLAWALREEQLDPMVTTPFTTSMFLAWQAREGFPATTGAAVAATRQSQKFKSAVQDELVPLACTAARNASVELASLTESEVSLGGGLPPLPRCERDATVSVTVTWSGGAVSAMDIAHSGPALPRAVDVVVPVQLTPGLTGPLAVDDARGMAGHFNSAIMWGIQVGSALVLPSIAQQRVHPSLSEAFFSDATKEAMDAAFERDARPKEITLRGKTPFSTEHDVARPLVIFRVRVPVPAGSDDADRFFDPVLSEHVAEVTMDVFRKAAAANAKNELP
jgi:hypothetical protein